MDDKIFATETDWFKLSEMAEKAGVSTSTVYDYLRHGLLPPPVRISPTKSYFKKTHLERLCEIRSLRKRGFSIPDIRDYLGCSESKQTALLSSNDSVRIEIIDKALELFSRHHYEKTKIADITEALNIGSGTFYRYFKSKEELFLGCLERLPFVMVPVDAWNEVEKETDFILRLKKRGYAMLNAFPSYIGILNYAKHALGGDDEILVKKAAECIKRLVVPLRKDLEKAIKQGKVRKNIDVEMCAYILFGINETFGYRRLIEQDYSVEYGFGVIEDFIKHALAVHEEPLKTMYSCGLIDISGNYIELDSICFKNNENSLSGKYMNGELQIPFEDILSIGLIKRSGSLIASVALACSDSVEVELDEEDTVTGMTTLGSFSIKAVNIQSVKYINKTAN